MMQWADEIKIETPEQIDLSLEVAGIGSRLAAQCYDWTAKWSIVILVGLCAVAIGAAAGLGGFSVGGEFGAILVGAVLLRPSSSLSPTISSTKPIGTVKPPARKSWASR